MTPDKQAVAALNQYADIVYLTCEPSSGPWPDDPDGGEMRIISALRAVAALHEHTDYDKDGQPTTDPAAVNPLYGRRCSECGPVRGNTCPTMLVITVKLDIHPVNEGGPSTG